MNCARIGEAMILILFLVCVNCHQWTEPKSLRTELGAGRCEDDLSSMHTPG